MQTISSEHFNFLHERTLVVGCSLWQSFIASVLSLCPKGTTYEDLLVIQPVIISIFLSSLLCLVLFFIYSRIRSKYTLRKTKPHKKKPVEQEEEEEEEEGTSEEEEEEEEAPKNRNIKGPKITENPLKPPRAPSITRGSHQSGHNDRKAKGSTLSYELLCQ